MKISVIKKDIDCGIPKLEDFCPVALALKRKGVKFVCIDGTVAEGTYKHHPFRVDLPRKAKGFITRFDKRKPVKPFSFILNIE